MKFTVKFVIEEDDYPQMEDRLQEVIDDLIEWQNDLLRQEIQDRNDDDFGSAGWYNNFDYEVEI